MLYFLKQGKMHFLSSLNSIADVEIIMATLKTRKKRTEMREKVLGQVEWKQRCCYKIEMKAFVQCGRAHSARGERGRSFVAVV